MSLGSSINLFCGIAFWIMQKPSYYSLVATKATSLGDDNAKIFQN